MVRQYSLCGNPADRRVYRPGVLLDPASRGGSAAIHTRFHTGSRIKISPPRNLFPLAADARHSVLIGGGIGFTPLIAMAYHLEGAGDFTLHYCARAHDKAAFLTELNEAGFRDRVHLHFDDGPRPQRFDRARDIPQPADDVHLYVCGPDGFVAWIIAEARRFGYREPHSHREYFKTALDRSGEAFDVVLSRSNRRVTVGAESTIVAALADAGVKITTLLRGGDLRHLPVHRPRRRTRPSRRLSHRRREGRERPDAAVLLAVEDAATRARFVGATEKPPCPQPLTNTHSEKP